MIVVEGGCTLVDAITAANDDAATGGCSAGSGADEIVLTGDVTLTAAAEADNGLPIVRTPITVRGNGFSIARDSTAPDFRLINVDGAGQADLTLEDLTLSQGALPGGLGGALFVDFGDQIILTNVTVSDNSALRGGGIYASYGSDLSITDSRITGNAAERGGGIYSLGGNVVLYSTTVAGNSATEFAGGLSNRDGPYSGFLSLHESTVSGNTAPLGGGIGSFGFYVYTFIANSTISGNSAIDSAGGVHIDGWYAFLSLRSSTIANNSTMNGLTGGVEVYDGSSWTPSQLEDSVVALNLPSNCGISNPTDVGGNLADDTSCGAGWLPMTGLDVELSYNGGPTRTHALLEASAAIDAGVTCFEGIDQRGFPRDDGSCDSGAFEFGHRVLTLVGECPGTMTLVAARASPDTQLEIFEGPAEGSSQVPAGVCAGTELDLDAPVSIAFLATDGAGSGSLSLELLAADCGQLLQGVDEGHCGTTDLVPIDDCDRLTLSHTGSGADPVPSPLSSPGCTSQEYLPGEQISLTAQPDSSWAVAGWSGTDDDASTSETNSVTMPSGEHIAAVDYAQTCWPLTVGRTGAGSIPTASPPSSPGCPAGEYAAGDTIDLSGAAPSSGWGIAGWTGTDDDTSTASANSVTLPAADHSATVDYARICFGLTRTHTGQGADPTASPPRSAGCPVASYLVGEVVDLTAAADPDWQVGSWSNTDDDASSETTNTVTMPAIDLTVGVNYVGACHPLSLEHTGAGADPMAEPRPNGTAWNRQVVTTSFDGATSAVPADMDGDGDLDILSTGSFEDRIRWYENTLGDGTSWVSHEVALSVALPASAEAADIDGDDDLDVVAAIKGDDEIIWFENRTGTGVGWNEHVVVDNFFDAVWANAADVDGDGDLDIIGASIALHEIRWWENVSGDGSSWTEHFLADMNGVFRTLAADIDGDDDLDVVAGSMISLGVQWLENTSGDGTTWATHVVDAEFHDPSGLATADLDGDSDLDILGAEINADRITWWSNDAGDGTVWTTRDIDTSFDGAGWVSSADLDADGDPDVLGAAIFAEAVTWWENSAGDASTWITHPIDVDLRGSTWATAADIDGDAALDVLGAGFLDDEISVWMNLYDGTCPPGSFRTGDSLALTAAPDAGWEVAGWSGTDDDSRTALENTATMPSGAHTISVSYAQTAEVALSVSGTCPGDIEVEVSTTAPDQKVQIYLALSEGTHPIPSGACAGTELDLTTPRKWRSLVTDGNGRASFNGPVSAAFCGRPAQALDRGCSTSAVVAIP